MSYSLTSLKSWRWSSNSVRRIHRDSLSDFSVSRILKKRIFTWFSFSLSEWASRKFNFSTQSYSVLKSSKHVDVDILLSTNKRRSFYVYLSVLTTTHSQSSKHRKHGESKTNPIRLIDVLGLRIRNLIAHPVMIDCQLAHVMTCIIGVGGSEKKPIWCSNWVKDLAE